MRQLRSLEQEVSLMREGYNQAVEVYNTRIERVPEVVLARICHFETRAFFN